MLPRLGIVTLGEFARLPASQAVNRFGTPGGAAHRLARGLDPRPLAARPPAADLSVSVAFDPPAELAEPVVFAAKALAEQMHDGLAARGLACVRVQVQVISADGQEHARLWRHDGLLSALAVAERVRWQLAGWRPGASGPSAGMVRTVSPAGSLLLRLVPDQLVRDDGRQLGLWGDAVVSDRVARAALRVQAMLGHGAVTRPVLGRRPQPRRAGDAGAVRRRQRPGTPAGPALAGTDSRAGPGHGVPGSAARRGSPTPPGPR